MWAGVVAGKYRTGNSTPLNHNSALKKQNSEHNFKPVSSPVPTPESLNDSHKLIRSRTYFDYTRRFSNSSNESYSGSSRRPSNQSTSSNGSRKGSGPQPPLVSTNSLQPRTWNKKRVNLSGAGRGNLAAIKAETSVDLVEKQDSNETTKKHMFY